MKCLLIVGAGGHGRSVAEAALAAGNFGPNDVSCGT